MTWLLFALAATLLAASAWELSGALGGRLSARPRSAWVERWAVRLDVGRRLTRAGLAGRLESRTVLAGKGAGALLGSLVAVAAAPVVSPRLGVLLFAAMIAGGFLAPDAILERRARRRHEAVVEALPDALDMLGVGVASGRPVLTVFAEISRETGGPLAAELARTVAECECGVSVGDALARLRARVGGGEFGALAAAIERSRTYGSPLAEQLHLQATALRRDARRRTEERAARAAPKIQLVIALVLVPSVLLVILAAIVAHSDELLGGLTGPG